MLVRVVLLMLALAVVLMPAQVEHLMLVRVVLQTLAPVARRTLGPVGHATLAPVDHAILAPEADGIARPFVNDSNTPPNKKTQTSRPHGTNLLDTSAQGTRRGTQKHRCQCRELVQEYLPLTILSVSGNYLRPAECR